MKARLIGKGFATKVCRKNESIMYIGIGDKNEFDIGRSQDADCCIVDKNISRKHAKLKFNHENKKWTITDNKSANGVLINDSIITPSVPFTINNGDKISIPTENDTYTWILDCETNEPCDTSNHSARYILDKDAVCRSKVERVKSINHHIDESQQFQINHILKEKQELDNKVKESERIRENLQREKNDLAETLTRDRNRFIDAQEKEREEFELKLTITKKETIESQRKEFEERLKHEKDAMEKQHKEAEIALEKKSEDAENSIKEALKERDEMMSKMEEEKAKAEEILENERLKYEKEVETLKVAFANEKENVNEYKEALEKINAEFQEKLNSGKKEFEASIAKEKADKEAERLEKEKMRDELQSRHKEITELKEQLNLKRKREECIPERDSKKLRAEEKARFLEKCNDELKCSICDDIFIEPMTLNCGHVYCQYCLESWKKDCKKKKKSYTCPNCRSIISSSVRSIHLDNLISAIFKDANEEVKKDREELVKERQAEESRSSKNSQPKKTANEKITTVRNYFQLSNPPNNHSRLNENEVSNIVASSAQASRIQINDSVNVHNNHHTSIDNSEENINLLPIILPNTSNVGEYSEPSGRTRSRMISVAPQRTSPRLRPSRSFRRRATLSTGEVVRIRIVPPRQETQTSRTHAIENTTLSSRFRFRIPR